MNKHRTLGFAIALAMMCMLSSAALANVEGSLAKAREYMASGSLRSALITLQDAASAAPEAAEVRRLLGRVRLEMEDWAAAEKELRRAQTLGSPDPGIVPDLAMALIAQQKYQEAIDEIQTVDRGLSPEQRAHALASLAYARHALGKSVQAQTLLVEAKELNPEGAYVLTIEARMAINQQNWDRADAILRQVTETHPDFALAWVMLAEVAAELKETASAEHAFARALELRHDKAALHYQRGILRVRSGDLPGARQDLQALSELQPNGFGVPMLAAQIAYAGDDYAVAVERLEQALGLVPTDFQALLLAGGASVELGLPERAEDYLQRALDQAPASVPARMALAALYFDSRRYPETVTLLEPLVRVLPDNLDARRMLAGALVGAGRSEDAVELLQTEALDPDDAGSLKLASALALTVRGETDAAAAAFGEASWLSPNDIQVQTYSVLSELRTGDPETALKRAEAFRDRDPESPKPWILIGLVQEQRFRLNAAREAFARADALAPGEPQANMGLARLAAVAGDLGEEEQRYRRILEFRPENVGAMMGLAGLASRVGKPVDWVAWLMRAAKTAPTLPEPRVQLARYYLLADNPTRALEVLAELPSTARENPRVLVAKGIAELSSQQAQQALNTFQRLAAVSDRSFDSLYYLSRAAVAADNDSVLRSTLAEMVALEPEYDSIRFEYLYLLYRLRDEMQSAEMRKSLAADYPRGLIASELVAAERTAALGTETSPPAVRIGSELARMSSVRRYLQRAEEQLRQRHIAHLIAALEGQIQSQPADPKMFMALAKLHREAGHREEMLDYYQRVLDADATNVVAINNLAWYLRDSDPERALTLAKRARKLAPHSPVVLDTLAAVEFAAGNLDDASAAVEQGLQIDAEDTSLRYRKALIMAARGNTAQAIDILSDVLASDQNFPERNLARIQLVRLSDAPTTPGN